MLKISKTRLHSAHTQSQTRTTHYLSPALPAELQKGNKSMFPQQEVGVSAAPRLSLKTKRRKKCRNYLKFLSKESQHVCFLCWQTLIESSVSLLYSFLCFQKFLHSQR